MTIAVDFDGTIVENRYPKIGDEIPFATDTLKMLIEERHQLILWTCREGQLLEDALAWCDQRGIRFYAINRDYPEETTENNPSFSRKIKADMFIDDRNLGGLPDWGTIYRMVKHHKKWEDMVDETTYVSSGHRHHKNYSCGSTKNVAYFQNSDSVNYANSVYLYDAHIMPKDQLTITVSTVNKEAAVPFNLTVPTPYTQGQRSSYSQEMLQSYLVDNEGNINFPIIGRVKVMGLTKSEAERMLEDKIRPYMAATENPIVTVRMSSYSISVLGEVARPGSFQVSREKITILEALAQAGDLTIYGVRDKVKLIRVYVEPNKVKAQNSSVGSMTTLWFSATSILISLASLLYNILK